MSQTSQTWQTTTIGQIISDIADGGTPKRAEPKFFGGSIPWVVIDDIQNKISRTKETLTEAGLAASSAKLWPKKTLILSTGATLGEVGITQIPVATKQGIVGIIPKPCVTTEYLFYYFQSKKAHMKAFAQGSSIKEFRPPQVRSMQIFLPPISEQQKIAEILGGVDEAIGATRRVIEKTRQLKRAMLQQLLTNGIPGRHAEFKDSPLGKIPAVWITSTLQEMAVVQTGYAKNSKKKLINSISVPYLRVANVQDGYLNLSEMKIIEIEQDSLSRYLLKPGDVLLNEGGDADKLGRGCVWMGQIHPCIHQNHVFAVRCKANLLPDFLTMQTSGERGKRYFLGASKQTTNLASINSTQLKKFKVVLPPLTEQQEIVAAIAAIDMRLQANEQFLQGLERAKEGLLHKLLSGEIRVTGKPEKENTHG